MHKNFLIFTLLCVLTAPLATHAFTLGSTTFDGGWQTRTLTFDFNASSCPAVVSGALDRAIALWNKVPTSYLKLARGADVATTASTVYNAGGATTPVIVCSTSFSTLTGASANAVVGLGFYSASGGYINQGGVVLNYESGGSANVAAITSAQLDVVLAHEMGHVLGLGHSETDTSLMYYNVGGKEQLRLAQDDIDGLTYLYPRDELAGKEMMGCGMIRNSGDGGVAGSHSIAASSNNLHASRAIVFLLLTLPLAFALLLMRYTTAAVVRRA